MAHPYTFLEWQPRNQGIQKTQSSEASLKSVIEPARRFLRRALCDERAGEMAFPCTERRLG
jgi:hypothetical protein